MKKIILYWNTVKYLRITQLVFRLLRFLPRKSTIKLISKNSMNDNRGWMVIKNNRKSEIIDENNILLLNEIGERRNWTPSNKSLLWNYHINYFDFASDVLTKQEAKSIEVDMLDWIKSNTDSSKTPWDSYPTSLRIINWIKFYLNGNPISQNILDSLANQASYLEKNIEYDLYGNHLFRNAKALCFAGALIRNDKSAKWLQKGKKILSREITEQILNDGGNFELSPMYHSNMVEDMLDLINLIRAFDLVEFDDILKQLIVELPKTFQWLSNMCHPDKEISFFNDSTLKASMSLERLKDYTSMLGINEENSEKFGTFNLKNSGYAVIKKERIHLICDTGIIGPNYMPGHSHADCLCFELSIDNKRIFVNSGISEYGSTQKRLLQRKTNAHNTISIDGLDSSEVWESFRVGRRAFPYGTEVRNNFISSSHNGFKRNFKNITHSRQWSYEEDRNNLQIVDSIEGNFRKAEAYFYIHPEINVYQSSDESVELKYGEELICYVEFIGGQFNIQDSFWYPEFGKELNNKRLLIELLDKKLTTNIRLL